MTAEGYLEGELFLGRIAAKQQLSGIVVKLAREGGEKARAETAGFAGVVTDDHGQPVGGGRLGVWRTLREMDRVNVPMQRGRTVPRGGYEMAFARVGADGRFTVEGLPPGPKFLLFEASGRPSTLIGPIDAERGKTNPASVKLAAAGVIEGRVDNVPGAMAGTIWVVAFDERVVRREVRISPDGTFRIDDLPAGRYGLKAGHDGYEDPHNPMQDLPRYVRMESRPWSGAVEAAVTAGQTTTGVVLDFRPPPPLEDPAPEKVPAADQQPGAAP